MSFMYQPAVTDLIVRERDLLARIAAGGSIQDVLRDLVLLAEQASGGGMLASVLFLSPDGGHLLEGAAPNLPSRYNAAIHGIAIGPDAGSCGTAAFLGEPVIVTDIATDPLWANFRGIALEHGLRACWSMPIKSATGSVLGTFANYYREPREPTDRDMEIIAMVARTTGIAIERHRHEAERRRIEDQRALVVSELNHRVKNVFALAGALIGLSARHATDARQLAETMQERLGALARAHDLVRFDVTSGTSDAPILRQVIDEVLAPYRMGDTEERILLTGPDVPLTPGVITSIALVFHELATNAVKHGGLRSGGDGLSVLWVAQESKLHIVWSEKNIAATDNASVKKGFGSTLVRTMVESQLQGKLSYDWREGLTVTIELPLRAVSGPAPGGKSIA